MAAGAREEFTLVIKAKDEAARVLKAIGPAGLKAAKEADTAFRKTGDTLDRTGRKGTRAFASIGAAASGAGRLVKNFLRSSLLPMVAAFASIAGVLSIKRQASDFATAMSEVATIVDTTETSMEDLRREVLDLAKELGSDEITVAKGLYQAISAGSGDAAEAVEVLHSANKLAIAGLAEVDDTVRLLASSLNAYKAEVSEAEDFSDALFTTVRKGITTIPELAGSLAQATPFAASLGVEFDELLTAVAAITKSGTPTAEAVTQVRAVIVALLKNVEDVAKALQGPSGLGPGFSLARIRSEGLIPILDELRAAYRGNEDQLTTLLGRVEATNAVLNLTGENAKTVAEVLEAMRGRAGATGDALEKRLADPAERVRLTFNALRIEIVDKAGRAIIETLDRAIERMGGMEELLKLVDVAATGLAGAVDVLARGLVGVVGHIQDLIDRMGGAERVSEGLRLALEVVAAGVEFAFETARLAVQRTIDLILTLPELFIAVKNEAAAIWETVFGGGPEDRLIEINARLDEFIEKNLEARRVLEGEGRQDPISIEAARRVFENTREQLALLAEQRDLTLTEIAERQDFSLEAVTAKLEDMARANAAGSNERLARLREEFEETKRELAAFLNLPVPTGGGGPAVPTPAEPGAKPQQQAGATLLEIGMAANMASVAMGRFSAEVKSQKKALVDWKSVAKSAGETIESRIGGALRSVIDGSKSAGEAFKDFARGVVTDIASMIAQAAIMAALRSAFPGLFPAAKGAIFPGGLSFGPSLPAGIPGYAQGGVATQPQLAKIGEGRNFEAVVPMPDNRHIPVKLQGSGAGQAGPSLVLNMSVNGAAPGADMEKMLGRAMPKIIQGVERALAYHRGLQSGVRQLAGRR